MLGVMRALASILVILLALYVGAYFFYVSPGMTITLGGWHTTYPDYRVLSMAKVFSPLHQLDRQHLRPTLWAKPMTLAERRLIADLALQHVDKAETWTPNQGAAANSHQPGHAQ